jgi:hypothetical protein
MEPQEPNSPDNPHASEDALRRLEERLSRASEAAERLIAEAAGSAPAAAAGAASAWAASAAGESAPNDEGPPREPPPAGWQSRLTEDDRRDGDLELLMQFFQSVRELIPPELQRRLAEALRELLLAIRALIDWYLERSEQRRSGGNEVQDIPIL